MLSIAPLVLGASGLWIAEKLPLNLFNFTTKRHS